MSSSSSPDSSEDETPRPNKFDDFDFFDSDTNKDGEKRGQSPSTREKSKPYSHTVSPQDVLHGSNGTTPSEQPKKPRFVVRDNRQQQKTYVSSSKFEIKSIQREVKQSRLESKEKLTIRMPRQKAESDSNSSDSVFDVSPLSTPNVTPRPSSSAQENGRKPAVSPRRSPAGGDTKALAISNGKPEKEERSHARISNGEALSIEDLLYSSDSSPDSSDGRVDSIQKRKAVQRKKRSKYEEVQHRTEASSRHHRRRLLDAAAENSMDLSQLLEVVLEMEESKKTRRNFSDGRMGRNMLPPPIKGSGKKNMSFTNEQVHNIDRENQRLLRRLAQLNTRQRPSSASSVRSSSVASSCRSGASTKRSGRRPVTAGSMQYGMPPSRGPRTYHSATNRLRDQQRIERENMALLKRLQATRSSSALRRDNLLRDYERQTGRIVDTRPPTRRRQKASYQRYADYETDSIDQNHSKAKPSWQDSW